MNSTTRRAFIGFCATGAISIGFAGTVKALAGEQDLLRPPGAQDEEHFISTCLKCDRCRSICPHGAVSLATVENGLINARTPILDFHKGFCDFCDLCYRVCPTGAIQSFDETSEKVGVAIVQQDRCVAYFEGCLTCVDACPYEAISLDDAAHPVVDAEKCNGCGVCEYVCPALSYRSFSGGTRRGIVVVTPADYERLGKTSVEDESEMV